MLKALLLTTVFLFAAFGLTVLLLMGAFWLDREEDEIELIEHEKQYKEAQDGETEES